MACTIRQEKVNNKVAIGREEVKLSLVTDDMISYVANPKECTKKQLELINSGGLLDTRSICKKSVDFFIYWQWIIQNEIKEQFIYTSSIDKNKIVRNKFNESTKYKL